MRLHEEYINRHKLNVPIVRYDNTSQIIIRSKSTPLQWRIVTCRWRTAGYHPGYFEVCCKSPVRDGHCKEETLKHVIQPKTLYWDSYESGIIDLFNDLKVDFEAVPVEEGIISAWQIFLLIYDSWLAKCMSPIFFDHVVKSIDSDLSLDLRTLCYKKALFHIKGTEIEDSFVYQLKWWSSRHSKWMENLINV